MILPIMAYGDPTLRKIGKEIDKDFSNLPDLIENMTETMNQANGVGLAAPQIGKAIRLFLIDASPFAESDELDEAEINFLKDYKRVIINPEIISEEGEDWIFNEGCLSIPNINEDVTRKDTIIVSYLDENFEQQEETLTGLAARIFQHEYDHIEGILFTDKISSLKKRLLKKKLENISKGKVEVSYRMKFPKAK